MTYTSAEVVLIIGAVSAGLVSIITAWKVNSIDKRTAVIEGHVNSEKTKLTEQISYLHRENELLRSISADKSQVAAVLASNTSTPSSKEEPLEVKISDQAKPVEVKTVK